MTTLTAEERDFAARAKKAKRMLHMNPGYVGTADTAESLIDDMLAALSALERPTSDDGKRLDWLAGRVVDTIYLDDGKIVDVHGKDLRASIDVAMKRWPTSLADDDDDEKLAAIVADKSEVRP